MRTQVDLLCATGIGERMQREGLVDRGIELRFEGHGHRIPLSELTGGRAITVYGQQEVVKDLIHARLEAGGRLLFEVEALGVDELDSARPRVDYHADGRTQTLESDFVAGCDGFWGVSTLTAALPDNLAEAAATTLAENYVGVEHV